MNSMVLSFGKTDESNAYGRLKVFTIYIGGGLRQSMNLIWHIVQSIESG